VGDLLELLADRYRTWSSTTFRLWPPSRPTRDDASATSSDVAWDRDVRLIVLADGPRQQILGADLTDHARLSSRPQLLQTA